MPAPALRRQISFYPFSALIFRCLAKFFYPVPTVLHAKTTVPSYPNAATATSSAEVFLRVRYGN